MKRKYNHKLFCLVALSQASHHLLFSLSRGSLLTRTTPQLKTVRTSFFLKPFKCCDCECVGQECLMCVSSPAFNKWVSVNSQDFNLQLVDTAGQVRRSFIHCLGFAINQVLIEVAMYLFLFFGRVGKKIKKSHVCLKLAHLQYNSHTCPQTCPQTEKKKY